MNHRITDRRAPVGNGMKKQYAALPWRQNAIGLEVMLISSRETQRWVIPKGWPVPGLSPAETAAREAFEEAGIGGQVGRRPLGTFHYDKRLEDGRIQRCKVTVFGLEQMIQHPDWPEQGQRKVLWLPVSRAADVVQEPGLRDIIRRLEHFVSRH